MNATQIKSRLKKLLGPDAAYEWDTKAPDAEERAKLREKAMAAKAKSIAANAARDARQRELLQDPTYVALAAEAKKAREDWERMSGLHLRHPITVGTRGSAAGFGFFSVKAEGDTWAEVFAKLESKP